MDAHTLMIVVTSVVVTLAIIFIIGTIRVWWEGVRATAEIDKYKQSIRLQTEHTPEQITTVASEARRTIFLVKAIGFVVLWVILEFISPNTMRPVDQMAITIIKEILKLIIDILNLIVS